MDQQRKGQRLINYARFVKNRPEATPPTPCECFIWNISDEEFEKAMKWNWEGESLEDLK